MCRSGGADLFPFDSEIEKTARRLRKEAHEATVRPPEAAPEQHINTSTFTTYDNPVAKEHNEVPAARVVDNGERTLTDYMQPTVSGIDSAIRKPKIATNNSSVIN